MIGKLNVVTPTNVYNKIIYHPPYTTTILVYKNSLYSFDDMYYNIALEDLYLALTDEVLYVKTLDENEDGILEIKAITNDAKITKVANATTLSATKRFTASGYTINHAIISGSYPTYTNLVETYSFTLVKSSTTGITNSSGLGVGVSISGYYIHSGGYNAGTNYVTVNVYNDDLTKLSNLTNLSQARYRLSCATNKEDSFFIIGGCINSAGTSVNNIDMYTNLLTKVNSIPVLNSAKVTTTTNVGDYIIIAGGGTYNSSSLQATAEAYDLQGSKIVLPNLETATQFNHCQGNNYNQIGNYGVFLGSASTSSLAGYAYDPTLVRTRLNNVLLADMKKLINYNSTMFIFPSETNTLTVNKLDSNLVLSSLSNVSTSKLNPLVTKTGRYVLIAGGNNANVEVYYNAPEEDIDIKIKKDTYYSYDKLEYIPAEEDINLPLAYQSSIYIKHKHESIIDY